jgi:DNA (cytosine-5)-methyltransferase 1
VKVKQPKFLFLENVKHILKVDDGKVIEYIKNKLADSGYVLQLFKMSPHKYGIPQQRERIYFSCVRKDIHDGNELELIKAEDHSIQFDKFIDTSVPEKYYLKGDILIFINEFYKTYDEDNWKQLSDWKKDYISKNKPLYVKYKSHWDRWYEKHKELLSKREIYSKLEWQVGKIKPNDDIFDYFIQIRQSGIRVKRADFFPTLVAISQIPIYGKQKRYITPRECFRLQSFPDTHLIDTNDRHSYKQIGNAVNVHNAHNVILSTISNYL